jgi:glycosyltransferase involved in cell wall biosynthesis
LDDSVRLKLKAETKKLVLFTADFPYGTGETFLETEIKYLAEGFEHVHIVSSNLKDEQTRELPENCSVERLDLSVSNTDKLLSIFGLFSGLFWGELKIIHKVYRLSLSLGIIKTLLISMLRAKRVAKKVKQLTQEGFASDSSVYYSYWCDDAALGLAMASDKNSQPRSVCRIHRWDVYFDQSAVGYLPFRHYITQHLKNIFSISNDGIRYASEVWKVDTSNFVLSRLGIEAQEPMEERNDSIFTIVSCSNLIPVKRVHLIAQAVKALDGRFPLRWVHIGDGPERKRIESLISGLSDRTEVRLMGRMPNSEVFKLYRELAPDVFINVSSSEGVPVSIMEAMSFGIPVIATDVGGNGEIVNERNGKLLNYDLSPDLISTTLVDFIMESDEKSLKAKEAHNTSRQDYDAAKNYTTFTQLLSRI